MVYNSIDEIPFSPYRAIIINVGTRLCTTLAIFSVLKYTDIPLLVIDCEYDGNKEDFQKLLELQKKYGFDLLSLPLQMHGKTLDFIFRNLKAKYILLVDSDAEVVDPAMVKEMKSYIEIEETFGCGCIQGPLKLDVGAFYGKDTQEKGMCAERMWIPFTMLDVEKIKEALNQGKSFLDKTEYNIFPHNKKLSRFLYRKLPRLCSLPIVQKYKSKYIWGGGNTSTVVYYDTGAEIYEYLKNVKYYYFFGLRYESFVHEKYVKHYEGVTRKLLMKEEDKTAFDIATVVDALKKRLLEEYGYEYV